MSRRPASSGERACAGGAARQMRASQSEGRARTRRGCIPCRCRTLDLEPVCPGAVNMICRHPGRARLPGRAKIRDPAQDSCEARETTWSLRRTLHWVPDVLAAERRLVLQDDVHQIISTRGRHGHVRSAWITVGMPSPCPDGVNCYSVGQDASRMTPVDELARWKCGLMRGQAWR